MSDEWAVPSGMTPQDNPGQPKDGIGALVKRVRDNATEMRDKFNNLLKQAGIRVEQDLVRFTGAVRIEGTLSLPAGIIDNAALTSPIEIAADAGNADGFTVTTTDTGFITFTIPIPAGYTQALVKAEGMIWVYNASAVGDYLFTCLYVDSPSTSTHSRDLLGDLNPTSGISLTITKQTVFTGLTGGVITIRQRAGTTYASMYHASNAMTATASVWFLR